MTVQRSTLDFGQLKNIYQNLSEGNYKRPENAEQAEARQKAVKVVSDNKEAIARFLASGEIPKDSSSQTFAPDVFANFKVAAEKLIALFREYPKALENHKRRETLVSKTQAAEMTETGKILLESAEKEKTSLEGAIKRTMKFISPVLHELTKLPEIKKDSARETLELFNPENNYIVQAQKLALTSPERSDTEADKVLALASQEVDQALTR